MIHLYTYEYIDNMPLERLESLDKERKDFAFKVYDLDRLKERQVEKLQKDTEFIAFSDRLELDEDNIIAYSSILYSTPSDIRDEFYSLVFNTLQVEERVEEVKNSYLTDIGFTPVERQIERAENRIYEIKRDISEHIQPLPDRLLTHFLNKNIRMGEVIAVQGLFQMMDNQLNDILNELSLYTEQRKEYKEASLLREQKKEAYYQDFNN